MSISKLLRPEEVAELLGIDLHTLAVWRCEGRYNLPYVKVGRLVRYPEEGVRRFIERRVVRMDGPDHE